jgi:hypothetical protein
LIFINAPRTRAQNGDPTDPKRRKTTGLVAGKIAMITGAAAGIGRATAL